MKGGELNVVRPKTVHILLALDGKHGELRQANRDVHQFRRALRSRCQTSAFAEGTRRRSASFTRRNLRKRREKGPLKSRSLWLLTCILVVPTASDHRSLPQNVPCPRRGSGQSDRPANIEPDEENRSQELRRDTSMNTNRRRVKFEGVRRKTITVVRFVVAKFCVLVVLAASALFPDASLARPSEPESPAAEIRGIVTHADEHGQTTALAGVLVKLNADSQERAPLSVQSDSDGHFRFTGLAGGSHLLEVGLEGFKPFSVVIVLQAGESRVQDIRLELATVAVSIDVQGDAPEVTAHSADPNVTLTQQQLPALPLAQQKFSEALPLVPGVVRTMDGMLNIKGEVENQGMLLVDSAQMVDPVTGAFSVGVPLSSVETLNVYETPYNSQYGGFSGGLATIETKAPPDQWQYSILDFVPGLRMKRDHIMGVSAETPRLFVGGPLIKNRLNFSQSFDYTIKNSPVRGLSWPVNETKLRGFTSFTNLQALLTPKHLLTANVVAFSNRTQFADINALVPQTASSNLGSKGAFATLIASDQFSFGTLNTTFRYTRVDSNAYGQGDQDLLITPDGLGGNAFNRWTRASNQFEVLPTLELRQKTWLGRHDLKLGTDAVRQHYHGASHSDPIDILRENRSLAERIAFQGTGALHGSETEVSEFAQDHWVPTDRLAIDSGLRLTTQSDGRSAAFAPRLGMAYSLGADQRTVIRAGAGFFYDRVPLLAATFLQNPTRTLTYYDEAGLITGGPISLQNAYVDFSGASPAIHTSGAPGTSARDSTWNVAVERQLNARTGLRVGYLQSQTSSLYVVSPWTDAAGVTTVLGLNHAGDSHYHEFQAGFHYRAGRRADLNITYLSSQAKGSLNTLSDTFVPFEQAVIRPNVNDYLPADVPNRLLSSGIFHLPGGFTVSPVLDIHTGFRYSNVDVLDNYVGRPNSQRFPTYFSLDAKVYRDFKLPAFAGRLRDHRLRIGVYALNVTNHLNPHDVYNNIESPVFGHFVGFQHRVTGMLIDIVK